MNFGRIEYLYVLVTVPLIAIIFYVQYILKEKFLKENGLKDVFKTYALDRRFFKKFFFLVSLTFLILSLASPRFGVALEKGERRGRDIFFLIDVSNSMNATDIKPSRLDATKQVIFNLLKKMNGDRVGVAVFAGSCQIICPLTDDYDAVSMFVDSIDTDMISKQGTNLGEAIEKVVKEGFPENDKGFRTIIVFSDGEDFGDSVESGVKVAKENNVIIFSVGIGSKEGAPIPVKDINGKVIGFKKDKDGKVVITKMNPETLVKIAKETDGEAFIVRSNLDIDPLIKNINKLQKKKFAEKGFVKLKDRYYYPLAVSVLFLIAFLVL
ncbi:Ca-activated chloride channel homolog [Thermotomaculum hydrothermale]|uniref:Ca-activated chloride channel homolog n=1 Tax=Thermotomaculum hydrothermale TaxID=981385 RepID=A0A7R6PLH1_9BACT|nr:VWA domain-containing protein [Thermotomaculum hydrothermale]BBB32287.1 Ca-activated chloride channel homolog [Thermotomaculum hydrothermale]